MNIARLSAMGLLSFLATLAGCSAGTRAPAAVPDRVERFGEVELVTHTSAYRAGDTGRWGETQQWSLRWKGKPLVIDSFGGMWLDKPIRVSQVHSVFVLPAAQTDKIAELLVLVGDPNNGALFHRVRQDNGRLDTPLVCKTLGGSNAVVPLDGPEAYHVFQGPQAVTLSDTRYVLLGRACVYDARTQEALRIPQMPTTLAIPYGRGVAWLAPDRKALAFLAMESRDAQKLLMTEVTLNAPDDAPKHWRTLPIDAARMRYGDFESIDLAWIQHHFEWKRGADGRDRIAERARFKPLPWRGTFFGGAPQYNVHHMKGDQTATFLAFFERVPGAKRLPDVKSQYSDTVTRQVEVDGETLVVTPDGFYVHSTGKPYWPGKPGDPKLQDALIRRLGAAFDAELASGRHDKLFVERAGP